jgi:hypothetical protein
LKNEEVISMINYFKAAERTLSERGNLERALENLTRRKARIVQRAGPQGVQVTDYSKPYVSGGGANDALTDCLELAEVMREIETTRETIEEIDGVLSQLEQSDAVLLRAWYIDRRTKEEIAEELNYSSTTTVYDLRNKAVSSFAILYYGAGSLASI